MELPSKRTVLTRQGYDEIQAELDEILRVKRPAVVSRIREAIQLGDLSENFDYHDAKRQQGMLEGRIQELKAILSSATIAESTSDDGCVNIGSKVVVKDMEEGFEDEYMIVGPPEANPSEGKISYESCVGSALMGGKAGDVVSVESPGGVFQYEIVSVE
jgi:transcription elongation factor GreA